MSTSARVVISIDIGTTGCTWFFTRDGVRGMRQLDSRGKEPTVLLLRIVDPLTRVIEDDGDVVVVALGKEALKMWDSAHEQPDRSQYILVERFKMLLHSTREIGCDPLIPLEGDVTGIRLSVAVVKLLEYFAEDIRWAMRSDARYTQEQIDNALWVLTVPAIWSHSAKELMRKCAYRAGLITALRSPLYAPCHEPEGVLFANLEHHGLLWKNLKSGHRVLVVDCGGGTVDFCFLQVVDPPSRGPATVKILGQAFGHGYAGVSVDEAFLKYLEKFIGAERFAHVDHDMRRCLLSKFHDATKGIMYHPTQMKDVLVDISVLTLVLSDDAESMNLVRHCIAAKTLAGFYSEAVMETRSVLRRVCGCPADQRPSFVLIAGGFGKPLSIAIKECVDEVTQGEVKTLHDTEPALAVAKGAMLWGCAPHRVRSRTATATYGIIALRKMDSGARKPAFSVHVYEGQEIKVGGAPKEYLFEQLGPQHIELLSTRRITYRDFETIYNKDRGWILAEHDLDPTRDFHVVGAITFIATPETAPVRLRVIHGEMELRMEALGRDGRPVSGQHFEIFPNPPFNRRLRW